MIQNQHWEDYNKTGVGEFAFESFSQRALPNLRKDLPVVHGVGKQNSADRFVHISCTHEDTALVRGAFRGAAIRDNR